LLHGYHRGPYELDKVIDDTLDLAVADLAYTLGYNENSIIILSGREDSCREDTIKSLRRYGIAFDALHMRKTGDSRPDDVVKLELFDKHVRNTYNVLGVFDDRNSVVNMWRSIGLKCFQVQPGAF